MQKKIDITDKRFGRLIALREVSKTHWECICDCGNIKIVRKSCLTQGITKSCGCLRKEVAKKQQTKHGFRNERIYYIWRGIKERCLNPNSPRFETYGAKGITICEEWKEFVNFKDWAFDNGYKDDLTIDRIDNSKGYYPENCRWADKTTQTRNRGIAIKIKMNDGTFLYTKEFAELKNITEGALNQRIQKVKKENKELNEDNLSLGFEKGFKHLKYTIIHNGKNLTVKEYSEISGFKERSIHCYLKKTGKITINSNEIKMKEKIKVETNGEIKTMNKIAKELNISYNTLFNRARKISKDRTLFKAEELKL